MNPVLIGALVAVGLWLLGQPRGAFTPAPAGNGGGGGGGGAFETSEPFPLVTERPRVPDTNGFHPPFNGFVRPAACSQYSPAGECLPWGERPYPGAPTTVPMIPAGGATTMVFSYTPIPGTTEPVGPMGDVQGQSPHRLVNASEVF